MLTNSDLEQLLVKGEGCRLEAIKDNQAYPVRAHNQRFLISEGMNTRYFQSLEEAEAMGFIIRKYEIKPMEIIERRAIHIPDDKRKGIGRFRD